MSLKFTPEQFGEYMVLGRLSTEHARECTKAIFDRECAQAIFDAWLEEQPLVYGQASATGCFLYFSDPQGRRNTAKGHEDTHQARLVCIEEIEKEPCEHEPHQYWTDENRVHADLKCKHCDVKLKAKWEKV